MPQLSTRFLDELDSHKAEYYNRLGRLGELGVALSRIDTGNQAEPRGTRSKQVPYRDKKKSTQKGVIDAWANYRFELCW